MYLILILNKFFFAHSFVDKHEQEMASSLMITFLGIGISTGSLISFGMVNLL